MQRYFARKGDKTTANGTILEGEDSFIQEGLPVAFHGAQVYCPACNSTGVIFTIPPHHPWTINDKQLALDGDLCICKCSPPPRLLASQSSAFMSFNENSAATSTRNGANASELLGVAVAGLASVAKASSDADYERMRQEAYGDPRYWTAQAGPPAPGTGPRESNVGTHPAPMDLSEQGKSLLGRLEGGLRLQPYDDRTGRVTDRWVSGATIGYGHLILDTEWTLYANGITAQEASDLFDRDIRPMVDTVNSSLTREVAQNQFDALVILCYNIGPRQFRQSSALQLVNDSQAQTSYDSVDDAWRAWNRAHGQESRGLNNRRNAELDVYNNNNYGN